MADPKPLGLVTIDGAPAGAKEGATVGEVHHCGGCRHAVLIQQANGQFDFNIRHCIRMPPQILQVPVFQKTLQGPALTGFQTLTQYPPVGRNMRGCGEWVKRSADEVAIDDIDRANAAAGGALQSQVKN